MHRPLFALGSFALCLGATTLAQAQPEEPPPPPPTATAAAPTAPAPAPAEPAAGGAAPAPAPAPPPPPGAYGPPPGAYAPPPMPPEAADPTVHNHDGFYLQMGIGGGYLSDSITFDPDPGITASVKGGGVVGQFLLGGTVAPGLVLGGGTMGAYIPSPKVTVGSQSGTGNGHATLSMLGVIVDWYVNPKQGLHLMAMLGYAEISATDAQGNTSTKNPTGAGFALGIGHEWWVGEQWGIGVLGRLQYAPLSYSEGGLTEKDNVVVPGLLFTATYH